MTQFDDAVDKDPDWHSVLQY